MQLTTRLESIKQMQITFLTPTRLYMDLHKGHYAADLLPIV